jgi:hypothetical protein
MSARKRLIVSIKSDSGIDHLLLPSSRKLICAQCILVIFQEGKLVRIAINRLLYLINGVIVPYGLPRSGVAASMAGEYLSESDGAAFRRLWRNF